MARDGPKWGREGLLPANPDLADILGRTDFDFENFYFLILFVPKFPDFQVPRFPNFQKSGRAWAGPTGPGGLLSFGIPYIMWPYTCGPSKHAKQNDLCLHPPDYLLLEKIL